MSLHDKQPLQVQRLLLVDGTRERDSTVPRREKRGGEGRGGEGMACARTHNHIHFTNRATKRAPSVGRPPGETRVKIPRKTLTPR